MTDIGRNLNEFLEPSYDAIIVAKNEPDLPKTIDSIRNQTVKPHRIICVVADDDRDFGEDVEVYRQVVRTRPGPSFPRNFGIMTSDCSIVACFDGDVVVPEWYMHDAISLLLCTGASMIGGENRHRGTRLLDRFNYRLLGLLSRLLDKRHQASIIGNNFIGFRESLIEIPFRQDLSMMEDADLSRRFRKAGKQVRFYRDIYVYTRARRIHQVGGWWRYLAMYFGAYLQYRKTGNVRNINYFR